MRIALVHDDLVQWGGAERVLSALSDLFPEAPIYTSLINKNNQLISNHFANKKVITSFIQNIPNAVNLYKAVLPLYPMAFEQFDFTNFDVVISQTTRFSKSIITKPWTTHICYCHTPPRFLWGFSQTGRAVIQNPYFSYLRFYDQVASRRVDKWIAGSINCQKRIKKIYKSDSEVIYPFVEIDRFIKRVKEGDYYLVVARLLPYKRVDLVIKLANEGKLKLKVVGDGPEFNNLSKIAGITVEMLGIVDEMNLSELIMGCKGLIVAGEEDFGLTPLEAQAAGKPVVAFGKGGSIETIIEGETGYFFNEQTVESLKGALNKLDKQGYNRNKCLDQASKFSKQVFDRKFKSFLNHAVT